MPIGSGRVGGGVGGIGIRGTPGIKGPHKGLSLRSPALNQAPPFVETHTFDAQVPSYPTGFAEVRASNATYYNTLSYVTTAASNVQRLDYNPSPRAFRGLLVEPAATNIALGSSDIWGSGQWTRLDGGSSNSAIAPDGTMSATTFNALGDNNSLAYQIVTATSGVNYTFSVYVKKGIGSDWVSLFLNDGVIGDRSAWFNVNTGAVGTIQSNIISTTSQNVGNGWFRFSVTLQTGSTSPDCGMRTCDADNSFFSTNGNTQLYWGAQLEQGSVPTSYIATTSSSATRAADAISFTLNPVATALTFTFDDLSTQTVSGLTGGSTYNVPTNLNRPWILFIDDNSAAAGVVVTLATTEAQDVAAFVVTETINAALAATEAADTAAINVSIIDNAALAVTEAQDVAAFVAIETDTAVLAATEAQDVAAFNVQVKDNAALAATEGQDTAAIVATVGDNAALAATEAQDVAAFVAIETDTAVLAATEAQDTAALAVQVKVNAAFAVTEAADVAAIVATVNINAALASTEAADVAAFAATVGAGVTGALGATEASDLVIIRVDNRPIVIPPNPSPRAGLRRIYPAAGVPGVYGGTDVYSGGTSATPADFSPSDFGSDFNVTGRPGTGGTGKSAYASAGALYKPLRRTSGPQMRRTFKYPTQLIPASQTSIYKESVPDVYADPTTYSSDS